MPKIRLYTGEPKPYRSLLTEMMVCTMCGHRVMRHILESFHEYQMTTLGARVNCHPDDLSEREIAFVCPDCNGKDTFIAEDYDE